MTYFCLFFWIVSMVNHHFFCFIFVFLNHFLQILFDFLFCLMNTGDCLYFFIFLFRLNPDILGLFVCRYLILIWDFTVLEGDCIFAILFVYQEGFKLVFTLIGFLFGMHMKLLIIFAGSTKQISWKTSKWHFGLKWMSLVHSYMRTIE